MYFRWSHAVPTITIYFFRIGNPLQKGIVTATKKVVLTQRIGNSDTKKISVSETDTNNRIYKEKCTKPRNEYFSSFRIVFKKVLKITAFQKKYSTFVLWKNCFFTFIIKLVKSRHFSCYEIFCPTRFLFVYFRSEHLITDFHYTPSIICMA